MSSSRYPDQWIVPGGGMEPEEEPGGAAVREVYEEVKSLLDDVTCIIKQIKRRREHFVSYTDLVDFV